MVTAKMQVAYWSACVILLQTNNFRWPSSFLTMRMTRKGICSFFSCSAVKVMLPVSSMTLCQDICSLLSDNLQNVIYIPLSQLWFGTDAISDHSKNSMKMSAANGDNHCHCHC